MDNSRVTPTGIAILDLHECWEQLRTNEVGRLAVSIANHPDIFPINYVVDHGTIVFRTAEGTKFAAAVLGSSVAFETDGYKSATGEAWSVVVKGRATEIENMYDLFDAQDLPLFPWNAAPRAPVRPHRPRADHRATVHRDGHVDLA